MRLLGFYKYLTKTGSRNNYDLIYSTFSNGISTKVIKENWLKDVFSKYF